MGFTCSLSDPGTWFKIIGQDIIILLVYVDDALFMGSNKTPVLTHKKQFIQRWKSHDLGKAKEYLGMRIMRNCKKQTITLDQTHYVKRVIKQFGQENCKSVSVPLPTRYNLRSNPDKEANATLQSWYQLVIGSLLHIMLGPWPDIAYSIIKMLQFSVNPTEEHLQKALYIVCYLSSTMDPCICYPDLGDMNGFIAYSDMDWGGDIETSQSTTCYAIFLANGIISWLSWQQKRVCLSSIEAEYVDMMETACQIQWIWNLYEEISFILGPLPLCVHNQGTIFLTSNPAQEGCTKHVQMPEHYICEVVECREIQHFYVSTN